MNDQIAEIRKKQEALVADIQKRGYANVVFIVSSLSMWQNDAIYALMKGNLAYRLSVVYVPFNTYSQEDAASGWEQCKAYFAQRGVEVTNFADIDLEEKSFKERFAPDILFYPQWYAEIYDEQIDIHSFYDRLVCLIPYGMIVVPVPVSCCYEGNHLAWRQYFCSEADRKDFIAISPVNADNVRIFGYPKSERYAIQPGRSPWKPQEHAKKKVVWAPHFTIPTADSYMCRSNFVETAEMMWGLAEKYKDTLQFAFKPHPRLMTELYKHEAWGKEKTDAYYDLWRNGSNTQLETGEYIELFQTSDALIHDCGSFTVEYMYTGKPSFFVSHDIEALKEAEHLSTFGTKALEAHYIGISEADVEGFIHDVVLGGNDPKHEEREAFKREHLRMFEGKTPSQLIYEDICLALGFAPYPKEAGRPIKVSVVMPIYNVDKYLRDALDSLVNQTYKDIEIVCVDDGSTDACPQILKEYAAKDGRITVLTQPNSGTLMARKAGVAAATGDYITFLDPDDWFEPDACEGLAFYAGNTGADILQFGFETESNGSIPKEAEDQIRRYFNRRIDYAEGPDAMLRECFINESMGFNQPGKLIKAEIAKAAFREMPEKRCNYAEDLCTGLMIFLYSNTLRSINKPYYHYRVGVGISTQKEVDTAAYSQMLGAFELFDTIEEHVSRHGDTDCLAARIIGIARRNMTRSLLTIGITQLTGRDETSVWAAGLGKRCKAADAVETAAEELLWRQKAIEGYKPQIKALAEEREALLEDIQRRVSEKAELLATIQTCQQQQEALKKRLKKWKKRAVAFIVLTACACLCCLLTILITGRI